MRNLGVRVDIRLVTIYATFEILLLLGGAFFGRAWLYSSQVAFFGSLLVLFATFRAYKKRVANGVANAEILDEEIDEWGENHETFPDEPLNLNKTQGDANLSQNLPSGSNLQKRQFEGAQSNLNLQIQNLNDAQSGESVNLSVKSEQEGLNLGLNSQKSQPQVVQCEQAEQDTQNHRQEAKIKTTQESANLGSNLQPQATNQSKTAEQNEPSQKQKFGANLKMNSPNYLTAFVPFRLVAYAVLVVGFLSLDRQGNLSVAAFLIALGAMPLGALIYGVKSNEN